MSPRSLNPDPYRQAIARLAVISRGDRNPPREELAAARNDVLATRLEKAIKEALDPEQPGYAPLWDADRVRLARLLKPTRKTVRR